MAQYFGSKPVFDWNPNGSAESGHDFMDQINEQKGNITNKSGEYQQAKTTAEGADKQFNDMFANRQAYSDMYNQAAQQAKVDQREQEYQKNLDAVNATRRAMYTLPSATNANSEVRLSQAQRDAALGRNMAQYQNLYNDNSALAQQAGDKYSTALAVAQNNAGQMLSQQNQDINTALANYQTKLDAANNEYNQLLQERNILRSIYGDMYDDEYNHRMQELEIWADNLQAETARYAEQQANYRAQLSKKAQDEALAWQKYMAEKQEKANNSYSNALAKQNDIDQINQVYSNYQKTLANLDKESSNLASYLFGNNSLFGTGFGLGQTTSMKANDLRNKGFEDYLYKESPYLQKVLRENYSDLLGTYGIK